MVHAQASSTSHSFFGFGQFFQVVATKLSAVRFLIVSLLVSLLIGCGGGSDILGPKFETGSGNQMRFSVMQIFVDGQPTSQIDAKGGEILVRLVDGAGSAIPNQLVKFSSDNGSVVFGNSTASVLTNDEGEARIPFTISDPTLSGIYNFTANASINGVGVTATRNFILRALGTIAKARIIDAKVLVGGSATTTLSTASNAVYSVKVVDKTGNPVANTIVKFTSNASDLVFANSSASVLTDSQGVAQIGFSIKNPSLSGVYTLKAETEVDKKQITTNTNIVLTATGEAKEKKAKIVNATVLPSDQVDAKGGSFSVQVLDKNGSPVAGKKVSFSSDNGALVFGNSSASVLTNSAGVAQINFSITDPGLSGVYQLTATTQVGEESLTTNKFFVLKATGTQTQVGAKIESLKFYVGNNATSTLDINGAMLRVRVVDASNNPVAGAKVKFDIDGAGITLTQSTSGVFLTDANGIAQIFTKPNDVTVTGAYTAKAEVTYKEKTISKALTFTVQRTNIKLSDFSFDNKALPSAGLTAFTIKVLDSANKPVPNIAVSFDASCGQITPKQASDNQGVVRGTYKSVTADKKLCKGTIDVTASTPSASPKTDQLTVESPKATSIVYTTTEKVALGVVGSGSASSGEIEFTVYSNDTPLANTEVIITKNTAPNDFSFVRQGNVQPATVKSDDKGVVTVTLYPGATPGPVEIRAQLKDNPSQFAISRNVSVQSGRVTQNAFSISLTKNVVSWTVDNNEILFNALLADRTGNPVPDGTTVSFVAEGGSIEPNCATKAGACTVRFRTQDPRPGDHRVSVLAYVEGDKAFIDVNKNNKWDQGIDKLAANIGDSFLDINEDNKFNEGEFIYKSPVAGTSTCGSFTKFNPNIANTCNGGLYGLVRNMNILLLSSDFAKISRFDLTPLSTSNRLTVRINSSVYPKNPMPSGTTVGFEVKDNTKFEPAVVKTDAGGGQVKISVFGAPPGFPAVVVEADKTRHSIPLTNGSGSKTVPNFQGDPTLVTQVDTTCEAVAEFGASPLPAIQNTEPLGSNLGTIHALAFSGCAKGDFIVVNVTSPRGGKTKQIFTVD